MRKRQWEGAGVRAERKCRPRVTSTEGVAPGQERRPRGDGRRQQYPVEPSPGSEPPVGPPQRTDKAWEWARARDRWKGGPIEEARGKSTAKSLMRPGWLAEQVLPADEYRELVGFADTGVPTECGQPWGPEVLEAAREAGPHKSASTEEAVKLIWEDIEYQRDAGFVRIVAHADLFGGAPPRELKISRVAVVPQDNRRDRIILNLSAEVTVGGSRRRKPSVHPSVNETTEDAADQRPVQKLGEVVPELLRYMHDTDCAWEIEWQKIDLSDGFWRMIVQAGKEHNFVFQLPRRKGDVQDHYVVPSALQMGWKNSPAYFCKATDVTRSLVARLLALSLERGITRPHEYDADAVPGSKQSPGWTPPEDMTVELQVFVDDFMNGVAGHPLREDKAAQQLWVNRAAMHAIHSVFPRPVETGHVGGKDSISAKKVAKGDATFSRRKELLGHTMDGSPGADRTVGLSAEKVAKYTKAIDDALGSSAHRIGLRSYWRLLGRLQYAAGVMPAMRGHFTPLNQALAGKTEGCFVGLGKKSELREVLADLRELIALSATHPSHITELVPPDLPHYYGTVDAAAIGFGGVLLPCTKWLPPTVWRVEMPSQLRRRVEEGSLTMVDCEFAAYFIGNCLLHDELLAAGGRVAGMNSHFYSDNSPTVGIVGRQATRAQSPMPARTLRWMARRQRFYRTGPQTVQHWAGEQNTMADFPSRSYDAGYGPDGDERFLAEFSRRSPLPLQLGRWRFVRPKEEVISAAFGLLRREEVPRLPTASNGSVGAGSRPPWARTLTSQTYKGTPNTWNEHSCSWPLLLPCGKVIPTAASPLQGRQSRERFVRAPGSWEIGDLRTLADSIKEPHS